MCKINRNKNFWLKIFWSKRLFSRRNNFKWKKTLSNEGNENCISHTSGFFLLLLLTRKDLLSFERTFSACRWRLRKQSKQKDKDKRKFSLINNSKKKPPRFLLLLLLSFKDTKILYFVVVCHSIIMDYAFCSYNKGPIDRYNYMLYEQ